MPDGSVRSSSDKSTFKTLTRERNFKHPASSSSTVPILDEFVAPHIESFNALFDDSGLPSGDGDGRGILSLAIKDIGERVVFDGNGQIGSESGPSGWGNRMSSKLPAKFNQFLTRGEPIQVWIEQVSISRPMVPDKDRQATERKVFPTEVSTFYL